MLQEITLSGERAQLEPLRINHAPDLWKMAQNTEIWRFFPRCMASFQDVEAFINEALEGQSRGQQLPFAIRDLESGSLVGSTRLMDFSAPHRSVEIGATWIAPEFWRTPINTQCKWLLLQHGFETLNSVRIFFKTDARNMRSQRAIERLGAQKEGILRSHMILPDGFRRDSVYYSILDCEWPVINARLQRFLAD